MEDLEGGLICFLGLDLGIWVLDLWVGTWH